MAKYESRFWGDFRDFLGFLDNKMLRGRSSASYEDGSYYEKDDVRCAVRVYERFGSMGSTHVCLTIVLIGVDKELFLSAISAGGSQAKFFKISTVGERKFLQSVVDIVEEYRKRK